MNVLTWVATLLAILIAGVPLIALLLILDRLDSGAYGDRRWREYMRAWTGK